MVQAQTTTKTNDLELTKEQEKALSGLNTWSGKIRYLHSLGWHNGRIARKLGKRPQHVSNVLRTPVTTPIDKV